MFTACRAHIHGLMMWTSWSWPPLAGHASGAQWSLVDPGHGFTVARITRQVSAVPNLPPPFSAVGTQRQVEQLLRRLARQLHECCKLDLEEAFVDATFATAKKGALQSAQRAEVRGQRSSL